MRTHHISPRDAKSVERPLRLVLVPIRCTCIAPVAEDRYQHFTDKLDVRVNGLLIEDSEIVVTGYVEGGRYAQVEFSGTIAVFGNGLMPAIDVARVPEIKFSGWVQGQARELNVTIVGEVVMAPSGGKVYSLVGADR